MRNGGLVGVPRENGKGIVEILVTGGVQMGRGYEVLKARKKNRRK